jgi:type IV pilus assembly protein PilE
MRRVGKGFTTLELLIAMVIVAILVSVALMSFHDHYVSKERGLAWVGLNDLANWLQTQRDPSGNYAVAGLPFTKSPDSGDAVYRFSLARKPIQARDPDMLFAASGAQGFTLLATPVDTSDACGVLILDQSGRRAVTGKQSLQACLK